MLTSPRHARLLLGLVTIVALLAGCAHSVGGTPRFASDASLSDAPDATVHITGSTGSEVDRVAGNAISDIQKFWTAQMPKVFNGAYRPVSGGFYSVNPDHAKSVPCVPDPAVVKNNAFYCPSEDLVVYDRAGLLKKLGLYFGKYAIAMVLAHEWGHAIQTRTRAPGERTIVVETQADCYSGAFTAYAAAGGAPHFHISTADLDKALSGYLLFADPRGADQNNVSAHGNGFDRVSAFQQGFDSGAAFCASPRNFSDDRLFTELPFSRSGNPAQDQSQNGNSPYGDSVRLSIADLAAYWKNQLPSWRKINKVENIDPGDNAPSCNGSTVDQSVLYCAANNSIYFDGSHEFPTIYQKFGDYSVATLLATAYSFAARRDLSKSITGRTALLGAICYSGAYTYDVFAHPSRHRFQLSPGDLDEALQALLLGVNQSSFDGLQGSTGFQRLNAFQVGFRQGFGEPSAPKQGCQQWS